METRIPDSEVKVKMSVCPDCGNAIRWAIEHEMSEESKAEMMKDVFEQDLQIKTISLDELLKSDFKLYCKEDCKRKKIKP